MNPERLRTRIRSRGARFLASKRFLELSRTRARLRRRLARQPARVQYFHQVDDPYSHLVVQKLDALREAYALPFEIHLVSMPAPAYQGNEERFAAWALRDAESIADAYGASLKVACTPSETAIATANDRLAPHLAAPDFAKLAFETGEALWAGRTLAGDPAAGGGAEAVRAGDALRTKLGHYYGGMFHFDGEWFWGIDRIRSLERRLAEEGHARTPGNLVVPEPEATERVHGDASGVTLEYFPSLRSPYTAVGHARVLDLIERTGVTVRLRPVMPMMMRGVPAPFPKQRYVIGDAAREARERGVPFGNLVDPIGTPVRRAFALFPAAVEHGRGMEFITVYLAAAWADGVDIATDAGLAEVAQHAGLSWEALRDGANEQEAEALLEQNVNDMLDAGLWGVPSFRVSGGSDAPFACWGQDRIWRVEQEIVRRATQ